MDFRDVFKRLTGKKSPARSSEAIVNNVAADNTEEIESVQVVNETKTLSMEGNITTNFTWREALFLPQWNRIATDDDGLSKDIKMNLIQVFSILQGIRSILGNKPIIITSAYRPAAYNKLPSVKGSPRSAHLFGKAVDFVVKDFSCDEVRNILLPHLKRLKIRMEDLPGSNWVHIDTNDRTPRFFKP